MPASLKIAVGRASASGSTAGKSPAIHLWETALIELEQGTPSEIAKRIQGAVTSEDRQQWQQGNPAAWGSRQFGIKTWLLKLCFGGQIFTSDDRVSSFGKRPIDDLLRFGNDFFFASEGPHPDPFFDRRVGYR